MEKSHFIWLVIIKNAFFFTSKQPKRYKLWSCQKIGTNCAPLAADLFLLLL